MTFLVVVDINVLPDILKCGNVCPNQLSNNYGIVCMYLCAV